VWHGCHHVHWWFRQHPACPRRTRCHCDIPLIGSDVLPSRLPTNVEPKIYRVLLTIKKRRRKCCVFWSITQDTICPKLGRVGGVEVWVHHLFIISTLDGVNSFTPQSLYSRGRLYDANWMGGWVGCRVG